MTEVAFKGSGSSTMPGTDPVDTTPIDPVQQFNTNTAITGTVTVKTLSGSDDDTLDPDLDAPESEPQVTGIYAFLMRLEISFSEGAALNVEIAEIRMKGLSDDIKLEIKEQVEKMEVALEKQQKAAKGGKFGKIFSWVAVAVTCVAAVAATVVTFGAAAPASALAIAAVVGSVASAGLTLTYQISAETGGWMQKGLTAMCGGNELAGAIVFMAVTLVLGAGCCVAGIRGLKTAVNLATEQKIADAAARGTTLSQSAARAQALEDIVSLPAQRALNIISGANLTVQCLGAGSSVYIGVLNYKKEMAAADVKEAQAQLELIKSVFDVMRKQLNERIQAATDVLTNNGGPSMMKMLSDAEVHMYRNSF